MEMTYVYEAVEVVFVPRAQLRPGGGEEKRAEPFPDTPEMEDFHRSLFAGLKMFPEARREVIRELKAWGVRWGWCKPIPPPPPSPEGEGVAG